MYAPPDMCNKIARLHTQAQSEAVMYATMKTSKGIAGCKLFNYHYV